MGNVICLLELTLGMIISLYYYLKIVRAMFMDKNETPIETLKGSMSGNLALIICAAGIIVVGLMSNIYDYINSISGF